MATGFVADALLTAEEYGRLDDGGRLTELVRGRVLEISPPKPKHGRICLRIGALLLQYVDQHHVGHVFSNDTGVITERSPDTVRGPDIAYFSYQRLPEDADLDEYPSHPPELVFEVKSPSDSWRDIAEKVAEYLQVGVDAVCIVDPEEHIAVVHTPSAPPKTLTVEQTLEFPGILPGFQLPLGSLLS